MDGNDVSMLVNTICPISKLYQSFSASFYLHLKRKNKKCCVCAAGVTVRMAEEEKLHHPLFCFFEFVKSRVCRPAAAQLVDQCVCTASRVGGGRVTNRQLCFPADAMDSRWAFFFFLRSLSVLLSRAIVNRCGDGAEFKKKKVICVISSSSCAATHMDATCRGK